VKDEDLVDRIIRQWREQRPDLDPSGKAVTGRIARAADLIARRNQEVFAPLGIKGGEYSALSALRRVGAPYELSPSQMSEQLMVTSGGLSLMLDRLERAGLVRRRPHPEDRRSVLVSLTDEGVRTINEAMTAHAAVELDVVSGLSPREVTQLAGLLAKLLRTNEQPRRGRDLTRAAP
jgi:DNA-binding MarR family transcriptional regulator